MMPLPSEQILQILQSLPEKDQRQILDFAEFLRNKYQQSIAAKEKEAPQSFFEAAKDVIGIGEGPGDLATNPVYMEGYGE